MAMNDKPRSLMIVPKDAEGKTLSNCGMPCCWIYMREGLKRGFPFEQLLSLRGWGIGL